MKKFEIERDCVWFKPAFKTLLTMKLIFLLVCGLGLLTSVAERSYAQSTKLTFSLKDASIKNVLEHIENSSEFSFMYENNVIDIDTKVDIAANDETIDVILNRLLGNNTEYRVIGRHIVLFPSSQSAAERLVMQIQQQPAVSGTVTDETGQPLPGVTVVVKGTTRGTVTNNDGNYSLTNIPEDAVLVFSFVGLLTQEIEVRNQTTINVTMKMDAIGIEEVVAVGYGVQKKVTLTGSIGTINSQELTKRPAANTTELLQGEVAGLITRQTSGLPGEDNTTLNIRGFGNPLILADGIQSDLAQIDPNDIESISVLRDASAAVYGARAGNGVILVTTKRGTNKPSQINYHGSVSFTQPTFRADLVDAKKWAGLVHETGLNPQNYMPNHLNYNSENNMLTNILTGDEFEGYDWAKAIYRDWVPQQQHNLNARGGNSKIRYFISAGFTDQESNFKSGDYDFNRYNLRSNIDANITDDLTVSLDFAYRTMLIDKAHVGVSELFNAINHAKPVYPFIHEADPSRATYSGDSRNAYYASFKDFAGFVENRDNVILGAIALEYSFPMIKGLVAKAQLNYEDIFSWNKTVSKPVILWDYDYIAAEQGNDPWINTGTKNQNRIFVDAERANQLLPLFSLEYDKNFEGHNIKGIIISETKIYQWTNLYGERKDILSYEAPYLNFASNEGKNNAEIATESARSSIISRINYDYLGKYMLEFAMRADASAEYPPKGRWGYFPSFSAGWRISEESFLKDNYSNLNNLKLRGSYGILGNDAVSAFDYLTGYEITGDYYIFGATPELEIRSSGLANPDITWETMKISNIGVDGTFWDGKFGFEIDAFYRLRENILAAPISQVPNTFGANLPRTNLNKRDNRGFEIVLSHKSSIGGFHYNISPMFSWTRGKFVEWEESVLPITEDMDDETKEFNRLWNNRYVGEGQWDDREWGFVTNGYFMNQSEIDQHPIDQDQNGNQTIRVGDIKFNDINGDNYIDWRDQQVIGKSGLPKIMYSLHMGGQYNGLSIGMLWQGASDYTVTFGGAAIGAFTNETVPLELHYKYRAIVNKDNNGNEYITNPDNFKLPPVTQDGLTQNNAKSSDFLSYDARFLRLKNLNLSYSLPQKFISKTGIKFCDFYMSGTNLFTFSNLGIWRKSFDPEIITQNNRDYPPVKTITFGLKLTI
jgi:TonB-linked SusC/RagA family outer membrane protein